MSAPGTSDESVNREDALGGDTLADSMLILLTLSVVQRLVGFSRAVIFCRWLQPDQLGQWDMAFSFLMLAAPVSALSLSGSFGRYVEYFRQRLQLRAMLLRTAAVIGCLVLASAVTILVAREWFSELIFGTPDLMHLVVLLAICLLPVVVLNYFTDLFTALRNSRLIAGLYLANSLIFAALAILLMLYWQLGPASVIVAYGSACTISSAGAAWWLSRAWKAMPQDGRRLRRTELWPKLIPFAASAWLTSLLANLFAVVDRYMIVHTSCLSEDEALACVGNYHTSRILPLLLMSVAMLLATLATPHLSKDWERGLRANVMRRIDLHLKLSSLSLTAAAVVFLFAAPLLFGMAFEGKFIAGQTVFPWTLTYCIWFGMFCIAQNYLFCREKAHLASLALLVGLLLNIGLNLVLLPRLGLPGAVLATATANLLALLLVCGFNRMLGFQMSAGTWALLALPPAICLGPWVGLGILAVVGVLAVRSDRLFDQEEKCQLVEGWQMYVQRFRERFQTTDPTSPE